jgi:hypothetical protein
MRPQTKTLHYYSSADYLFETIALKRIKVSRITELNDPYESLGFYRRSEVVDKKLMAWRKQTSADYGVICLSEIDWNPAMWAHYADRHRGVCYRFEVSTEPLMKVDYLEELQDFEEVKQLSANEQMHCLLSKKSLEWLYEREYRFFVTLEDAIHEGGNYFEPFSESFMLREIRLGMSCRLSLEAVRRAAAGAQLNIKVSKTKMSTTSFRMIEDRALSDRG